LPLFGATSLTKKAVAIAEERFGPGFFILSANEVKECILVQHFLFLIDALAVRSVNDDITLRQFTLVDVYQMKNHRSPYLVVLLVGLTNFACIAQQNLFNVPTSDIAGTHKLFYQQQLNFTQSFVQFNTTFSYGLGKNIEVGVNIIGLNVNTQDTSPFFLTNGNAASPPLYPFYTFNFQKAFQLNDIFKVAVGTQTGWSVGMHFGSYVYSNVVTIVPGIKTKLITGLYWGSNSFLGPEDRSFLLPTGSSVGTQIGLEHPILNDRVFLIAENISGRHTLGETSLGAAWEFSDHWVWSMAYQFPNPSANSSSAVVMELTYVPGLYANERR
jgi:hypothetical protein